VDVSKLKLDIALDDKQVITVENQVDGFKRFLKHIMTPSQVGVVMEATGGYGRAFAHFLLTHGIAVSVANAKRVRDYAKAIGRHAKNDKIDVQVIRQYGEMARPRPLALRSAEANQLDALIKRREQLVKQRTMEKQHLEATHETESIRSIE
jgi:transposase